MGLLNWLFPKRDAHKQTETGRGLLAAARIGDLDAVGEGLARGADVNGKDQDGFTPLMWATKGRYVDVVKHLLLNGADPNVRSKDGTSAATLASPLFQETRAPEYLAILKLLIDTGINDTIRTQVTMVARIVGIPEVLRLFAR